MGSNNVRDSPRHVALHPSAKYSEINECTNYEKPGIKDDIKELVHLRPYHDLD